MGLPLVFLTPKSNSKRGGISSGFGLERRPTDLFRRLLLERFLSVASTRVHTCTFHGFQILLFSNDLMVSVCSS